MTRSLATLTLILISLLMNNSPTRAADDIRVYLGTYTAGESEGIYVATLDRKAGTLSKPQLAATTTNPTFVALHPTKPLLYAVNEVGEPECCVIALAIDPQTGLLRELNKQPTQGAAPCHLSVDSSGRVLVVANYTGGSICSYQIAEDGSLNEAATFVQHEGSSVDEGRQTAPHAHSANFDPTEKYVIAADLGLDKLLVYNVNLDTAQLTPNDPPSTSTVAGGGPRHFAFHPNGKFAYSNMEMSSQVSAFQYHSEHGVLYGIQTLSTLPDGFTAGNSTAEVQVHPNGKTVYVSNRGHDSIAIFTVDQSTGELTAAGHVSTHGQIPRNFGIDPSGRFLLAANEQTDNVIVFRINPKSGGLSETGSSIRLPSPVCVKFWK